MEAARGAQGGQKEYSHRQLHHLPWHQPTKEPSNPPNKRTQHNNNVSRQNCLRDKLFSTKLPPSWGAESPWAQVVSAQPGSCLSSAQDPSCHTHIQGHTSCLSRQPGFSSYFTIYNLVSQHNRQQMRLLDYSQHDRQQIRVWANTRPKDTNAG